MSIGERITELRTLAGMSQFELSKATVSHHLSILKQADLITGEKKAQTLTDKFCEKIDKICADKEKEIMTV